VQKLADLNHDQAGGLLYRVKLALAKEELDEAMSQAQLLAQRMPEFAQSWVVLGQVYQAQSKYADAIGSYTTAIQKHGTESRCHSRPDLLQLSARPEAPGASVDSTGPDGLPRNQSFRELELSHEMNYGDPEKVIAPRQEQLDANKENPRAWLTLATPTSRLRNPRIQSRHRVRFWKRLATPSRRIGQVARRAGICSIAGQHPCAAGKRRRRGAGDPGAAGAAGMAGPARADPAAADFYATTQKPTQREAVLREYLQQSPQAVPVQLQLASLLAGRRKWTKR